MCFLILCDFPFGDAAFFAALEVPFIAQPSSGPAPLGMANHKCLITVSGDLRKGSLDGKGFNPVQKAVPGGPQFNFVDQHEKIHLFSDVFVLYLFGDHNIKLSLWRGARELHPAS
jgi:hypothetical protein